MIYVPLFSIIPVLNGFICVALCLFLFWIVFHDVSSLRADGSRSGAMFCGYDWFVNSMPGTNFWTVIWHFNVVVLQFCSKIHLLILILLALSSTHFAALHHGFDLLNSLTLSLCLFWFGFSFCWFRIRNACWVWMSDCVYQFAGINMSVFECIWIEEGSFCILFIYLFLVVWIFVCFFIKKIIHLIFGAVIHTVSF